MNLDLEIHVNMARGRFSIVMISHPGKEIPSRNNSIAFCADSPGVMT